MEPDGGVKTNKLNQADTRDAISVHAHTSVHVAALITRVNRWVGCGQLTLFGRSLSTTGAGRDCGSWRSAAVEVVTRHRRESGVQPAPSDRTTKGA